MDQPDPPAGVADPAATPPVCPHRGPRWLSCLATALVVLTAVVVLRAEGRRWWCRCGQPNLWSGDAWGPHNSQHFLDPYSLTHVLHGMILCSLLAVAAPRLRPGWRFFAAVALEAAWEVFENSAFVVERYRKATAALGYEGDTVLNSLGDILSCAAGFLLARRLGLWPSLAVALITEMILLLWIRDSLFLNVLMLLYPIGPVKAWQAAH